VGYAAGVGRRFQEAAQPYTRLAGLPSRTVRRRDRPLPGEQLLNGEGGLIIGGRNLHHSQARRCHMRVSDLRHALHPAPTTEEVLLPPRLHPTG
jgi:hypothetical protein